MMVPGASYITWGGMVRGEESRDRDIKKEKGPDDVAAVVWCRHRQDSGFQAGQTFPNARCAREEMVPSQVATPNNALARCCGTGLRCHLASSVAVCLGSEGRHRLALAIDPLVACRLFCTVICSLLTAQGSPQGCAAVLGLGVRPSCPTEQIDEAFHVMSFCILQHASRLNFTCKLGHRRAFQRTVDVSGPSLFCTITKSGTCATERFCNFVQISWSVTHGSPFLAPPPP